MFPKLPCSGCLIELEVALSMPPPYVVELEELESEEEDSSFCSLDWW